MVRYCFTPNPVISLEFLRVVILTMYILAIWASYTFLYVFYCKPFFYVKIVAVTSMSEDSWMERAREMSIESFWHKDVSEETILDVIKRTLAGESIYLNSTHEVTLELAKLTEFTPREIQVLRLLTTWAGNEEIAAKLKISQNTVKTHIKHLLEKTGFPTRTQLTIKSRTT